MIARVHVTCCPTHIILCQVACGSTRQKVVLLCAAASKKADGSPLARSHVLECAVHVQAHDFWRALNTLLMKWYIMTRKYYCISLFIHFLPCQRHKNIGIIGRLLNSSHSISPLNGMSPAKQSRSKCSEGW